MNKKSLSERDICTKFITPHLIAAGWDIHNQVREEVSFTDGRIYVGGKSIHVEPGSVPTTFCTTNRTFPSPSLRQRTTNTQSAQVSSKRWITPKSSTSHSSSVATVMRFSFTTVPSRPGILRPNSHSRRSHHRRPYGKNTEPSKTSRTLPSRSYLRTTSPMDRGALPATTSKSRSIAP